MWLAQGNPGRHDQGEISFPVAAGVEQLVGALAKRAGLPNSPIMGAAKHDTC
jgi:hypothetical protein